MSDLEIQSINSVVWEDDDGQEYRRVMEDGEIKDIPISEG